VREDFGRTSEGRGHWRLDNYEDATRQGKEGWTGGGCGGEVRGARQQYLLPGTQRREGQQNMQQ